MLAFSFASPSKLRRIKRVYPTGTLCSLPIQIMKNLSNRSRGVTLIELLVALAIVLALVALLLPFAFNNPQVTPAAPNVVLIGSWTTAPTSVQVGQPATFAFTLQRVNTGAGSAALLNETGTGVQFVTGPGTVVRLDSLNGTTVGSDRGQANTGASGNVNVIVSATSVPANGEGVLIGVPVGRGDPVVIARFEIVPR